MFAVFIDILGFASRIEQLSQEEHEALTSALTWSTYSTRGRIIYPGSIKSDALYRTYTDFQETLLDCYRSSYDFMVMAPELKSKVVSGIVFSDSAFVIFDNSVILSSFMKSFLEKIYHKYIPIRAGIGTGSFARLAFTMEDYPSSSFLFRSPFIGSAIVTAYKAESCGLKGLRAFVHPDAAHEFLSSDPNILIELPTSEKRPSASHEWVLGLDFAKTMGENRIPRLKSLVEKMRQQAPRGGLEHYPATLAALDRMETHLGFSEKS